MNSQALRAAKLTLATIISIFFLFAPDNSEAAYLTNIPKKVTQPNGEVLDCFVSGDEFYNWAHDENGYTIIKHPETSYWVYAVRSGDTLKATTNVFGKSDPSDLGLKKWAKISPKLIMQEKKPYLDHLNKPGTDKKEKTQVNNTGTINNVVIYIRFQDDSEFPDDTTTYSNLFNSQTGNSMYAYFDEASYNTLDIISYFYPIPPSNTVVSYQDDHDRGYFQPYDPVDNPAGYRDQSEKTQREHKLLKAAVEDVRSEIPPALDIDNDNDGYVDNVCFIIRGSEDSWGDLLWPHMWSLWSENVTINGSRVWTYNFQLEDFLETTGSSVLCHEMFHTLGAPDLYHYSQDNMQPVGPWDVMANTTAPAQHMGAWMKYVYGGWINSIPQITSGGTYQLNPITSSSNNCYVVASPNSTSEYFILEYRKKPTSGFESMLPGSGLLVYRVVPDSVPNGNRNGPPDEVYVYRLNGTVNQKGLPSQAHFSSDVGRTEINDTTNPSSFLIDGSDGGLNIYDIGTAGNTISFKISVGIAPPNLLYPVDDSAGITRSPQLTWNETEGAVSYNVEVATDENFTSVEFSQNASDTTVTISPDLDYGTQYYWRVNSQDNSDTSEWSSVRSFATILPTPSLVSPDNADYAITLNDTLTWSNVSQADSYQLQIDEESSFDSPVYDAGGIGDTTTTLNSAPLNHNTMYYWRIKALKSSPQTYSQWSQERSFTTILETPQLTSPADDSLGVDTVGTLTWNSVPGATSYHLILADNYDFDNSIIDENQINQTYFDFDGLNFNDDYFWKVQASNSNQSGEWSEASHFKTNLKAPYLSYPDDEQGGIDIDAPLAWNETDGADNYDVQVAADSGLSSPIIDETGLGDTTFVCSGLDSRTEYFWRARATSADGRISRWSEVWKFITKLGSPGIPNPTDESERVDVDGMLVWNAVTGATKYHAQLAEGDNFIESEMALNDSNITGTSLAYLDLKSTTEYSWRVRALTDENSGDWSPVWSFVTGLGTVSLQQPSNHSTGIPVNGTLIWQEINGSEGYHLQIAKDYDFNNIILDEENLASRTYDYSDLESDALHYWRVRAHNSADTGDWSERWDFATSAGAPVLVFPISGEGGLPVTGELIWNAAPGADNYTVQIATDENLDDIVAEENSITDTTFTYNDFEHYADYYWRVKSFGADGESPWSEIRNFTTVVGAPTLRSPENESRCNDVEGVLEWNGSFGAESYRINISENVDFEDNIIDETGLNSPEFEYSDLEHNKRYYWRTKAEHTDNDSEWSSHFVFYTNLAAVRLDQPSDSAVQVPTNGKLIWHSVAGYESYRAQISTSPNFATLVADSSGLPFAYYNYSGLDEKTRYYWRAKAEDNHCSGEWSDPRTFMSHDPDDVEERAEKSYRIEVYPNPASDKITFRIFSETNGEATLQIYNKLGSRAAKTLAINLSKGENAVAFDASELTQGAYSVAIKINERIIFSSFMILR